MDNKIVRTIYLQLIFVISILVDSYNGFLQVQRGIHSNIGIAFRLFIIFAVFTPIIYYKKTLRVLLFIPFIILCMLYWNAVHHTGIIGEVKIFVRIAYTFLFILFFYLERDRFPTRTLFNYVSNYGLIIALIVITCSYLGIGNMAYGENYGFGNKGFFKAGNDIALAAVFSLGFSLLYYVKYSTSFFALARSLIIAIGTVYIGTRVGILATVLLLAIFLIYVLFVFSGSRKSYKTFIFAIVFLFCVPYMYRMIYGMFDHYARERFTIENMEGAREHLTKGAILHISQFEGFDYVVGRGSQPLYRVVADVSGSRDDEKSVESDGYEMIGSYGYGFGGCIILFYVSVIVLSIHRLRKNSTFERLVYFILATLFLGAGIFAGHAVANVMVAPLYGILFLRIVDDEEYVPVTYD